VRQKERERERERAQARERVCVRVCAYTRAIKSTSENREKRGSILEGKKVGKKRKRAFDKWGH